MAVAWGTQKVTAMIYDSINNKFINKFYNVIPGIQQYW